MMTVKAITPTQINKITIGILNALKEGYTLIKNPVTGSSYGLTALAKQYRSKGYSTRTIGSINLFIKKKKT